MTNTKYFNTYFMYLLIALVAVITRLLFILYFPTEGGDWSIYSTVAENILSGC